MNISAVLFDLDGTLLPMDQEEFTRGYFGLLAEKMSAYGYDKKQLVAEDMAAQTAGIDVFLLTDCLINKGREDISRYPRGSFEQLIRFIESNKSDIYLTEEEQ